MFKTWWTKEECDAKKRASKWVELKSCTQQLKQGDQEWPLNRMRLHCRHAYTTLNTLYTNMSPLITREQYVLINIQECLWVGLCLWVICGRVLVVDCSGEGVLYPLYSIIEMLLLLLKENIQECLLSRRWPIKKIWIVSNPRSNHWSIEFNKTRHVPFENFISLVFCTKYYAILKVPTSISSYGCFTEKLSGQIVQGMWKSSFLQWWWAMHPNVKKKSLICMELHCVCKSSCFTTLKKKRHNLWYLPNLLNQNGNSNLNLQDFHDIKGPS